MTWSPLEAPPANPRPSPPPSRPLLLSGGPGSWWAAGRLSPAFSQTSASWTRSSLAGAGRRRSGPADGLPEKQSRALSPARPGSPSSGYMVLPRPSFSALGTLGAIKVGDGAGSELLASPAAALRSQGGKQAPSASRPPHGAPGFASKPGGWPHALFMDSIYHGPEEGDEEAE